MQAVLRSWAYRREGGGVVLEFLRLQMAVHHPLGAVTEEEGALWGDQGVWARQLARMYCNVVDTTIRTRARQLRRAVGGAKAGGGGSLGPELEPELLSLVRQLLLCPTAPDLGGVTQLVPLDVTQVLQLHRRTNTIIPQVLGAAGPAAKRRRMSSHDVAPGGGRLSLDSLLVEGGRPGVGARPGCRGYRSSPSC